MIDAATGIITLGGVSVGPSTTLAGLRRTPLGEELLDLRIAAPPWESYSAGARELGGQRFQVSLSFEGGRLALVSLSLDDESERATWDSWSKKREKERKKSHDRWLAKFLGEPTRADAVRSAYDYPWGHVVSSDDPRSASSSIVVSYRSTIDRE